MVVYYTGAIDCHPSEDAINQITLYEWSDSDCHRITCCLDYRKGTFTCSDDILPRLLYTYTDNVCIAM